MGVTLHGCFSILRLEVIKLNFENSYETRMGLVLVVNVIPIENYMKFDD